MDDAQRERLVLVMEECAEVQQVIAKYLRHGVEHGGHNNRIGLEHELGDLLWAVGLLVAARDISLEAVTRFELAKPAKAAEWLHHNGAEGGACCWRPLWPTSAT